METSGCGRSDVAAAAPSGEHQLHGGKSTGPTSAEGRTKIAAAARARHARARGNPLVAITVTADHTFLPLNAAGDVRHDWQSAGAVTKQDPAW
jgi:hypothetical protein